MCSDTYPKYAGSDSLCTRDVCDCGDEECLPSSGINFATFFALVSCLAYSSTWEVESIYSPEDRTLRHHCYEKLRSYDRDIGSHNYLLLDAVFSTHVTCLTVYKEGLHEMQCFVLNTLNRACSFDISAACNTDNERALLHARILTNLSTLRIRSYS
jgi:hypothetical protein